VQYWWRLDGALLVSAIFALVLENVIGTILSHVTDVKADLNVFAIFLFWMVIVRNALWLIVHAIRLFVLSVFRSMNANASLTANANMIFIKLTNRDADK
jgi:phosphatidylglycerophosphate synthase